jgi:alpha-L-arabinofuranosidase
MPANPVEGLMAEPSVLTKPPSVAPAAVVVDSAVAVEVVAAVTTVEVVVDTKVVVVATVAVRAVATKEVVVVVTKADREVATTVAVVSKSKSQASSLLLKQILKATQVVVDPTVVVSSSKVAVAVGKRVEHDTFSLRPCDTHVRNRGQIKKVAWMYAANGQLCSGLMDIIHS